MRKLTPSKVQEIATTYWGFLPGVRRIVPKTRDVPLLVMSMPRSGSSWIGSVLGASGSAAYMREPFTGRNRQSDHQNQTIFQVSADDATQARYRGSMELALRGIPAFPHSVVQYPYQWSLLGRAQRRVVIKEVNPLSLPYLAASYDFDVIFVVRHPLAITNSFAALGWWDRENAASNMKRICECWSVALEALQGKRHKVVRYEDICLDPQAAFGELLDWAQIADDDGVARVLGRSIGDGARTDTYSTVRNPKEMAFSWTKEFSQTEADQVFAEYVKHSPVLYAEKEMWQIDRGTEGHV